MISVLCPTRERPVIFKRMVESAINNGDDNFEILAYIDDDDTTVYPMNCNHVDFFHGPSYGVGRAWNHLAANSNGDVLMLANDDLVFRTKHWDTIILERIEQHYKNRMYVCWANDGSGNSAKRCTFPFVPRAWIKAVKLFVPEIFHFLYHDTWIHNVGKSLGNLLYLDDVLIEHKHFAFNKAEYDATYKRHRIGKDNQRKRREDENMFRKTAQLREQWAVLLREYEE